MRNEKDKVEKEKVKELYDLFKNNVIQSIKPVIDSSNFPYEFLLYYDDLCMRNEFLQFLRITNRFISPREVNINYLGRYRYMHNVIAIFELIIREYMPQKDYEIKKLDLSIVKKNINIIHENIDMILELYDFYIAKNALMSDRYDVEVKDNEFIFKNKDYSYEYNVQAYYEQEGVYKTACLGVNKELYKGYNKETFDIIYNWQVKKLEIFNETDNLGEFTVNEFLSVWSFLYLQCVIWNSSLMIRANAYLKDFIKLTADGITSAIESIYDFISIPVSSRPNFESTPIVQTKSYLVSQIFNFTNIDKDKISKVIDTLICDKEKGNYSMMEYPVIKTEEGLSLSSYYILNECHTEMLMQKKSKSLYENFYDKQHTEVIEPRICGKIKSYLDKCLNFEVKCSSQTINNGNSEVQSQIDIFIYDKKSKDIMIIEVKDHISKVDYIDITSEAKFEQNAHKKGGPIKQLGIQKELIQIQENLNLFLNNIPVNEIKNIYLGYCETNYLGTPRFLNDLHDKNIAFIPYRLITKYKRWKSVEELYSYFYNAQYLKKHINKKFSEDKIDRFGKIIRIPTYE